MSGAPRRFKILKAARRAVTARQAHYGGPEENFGTAGDLITVILQNKLRDGTSITPTDVALILDAVKTARLINDPSHEDSWVDKAGYAACGGEVAR